MSHYAEDFLVTSENKAFDLDHRRVINFNIAKYNTAVNRGLSRLANLGAIEEESAYHQMESDGESGQDAPGI